MFDGALMSDSFILVLGLLLIIGVLTSKFSNFLGVPALILYILIGMVIGSDGLELFHFDNYQLAKLIGMVALVIILFDGGLQTKWSTVKPVVVPSLSLATMGVILTSAVVGVFALREAHNEYTRQTLKPN